MAFNACSLVQYHKSTKIIYQLDESGARARPDRFSLGSHILPWLGDLTHRISGRWLLHQTLVGIGVTASRGRP